MTHATMGPVILCQVFWRYLITSVSLHVIYDNLTVNSKLTIHNICDYKIKIYVIF